MVRIFLPIKFTTTSALSPFFADMVDHEVNTFGTVILTRHPHDLHPFARFSSFSSAFRSIL